MAISSDGANQGRTNSGLRYVLVDVFTNKPLEGNQLAVFTDARGIASEQMQRLAREMNLSESVFVLPAEQGGDARIRIFFGRMQQPIPTWRRYEREAELLAALGVKRSRLPVEAYENGPLHVYVELDSEEAVAALKPDFTALASLSGVGANCFAGSGRSWKTRMFAPAHGVPEDPATGSAAGPLAIHLARHGRINFGEELEIRQGAEVRRPSLLYARA